MLPAPRRETKPELLDLPHEQTDSDEFERGMCEIRASNRFFGGINYMIRRLPELMDGRRVSLLDVATGTADIPVAMLGWASRAGVEMEITAVDVNPKVVGYARARAGGCAGLTLAVADALDLPFEDGSFDIVTCALALHHFSEADAGRALSEMHRVSRLGYVAGDLRRSRVSHALFYLVTRLFSRNRFTRHDGPLSIMRAYTKDELRAVARSAGLEGFMINDEPFWRMTLVGKKC